MRRGRFVTFEGIEGSGKSTQIRFAANYFRRKKKRVIIVREPGSTRIGERIRAILLRPSYRRMTVEAELFLYLAARAQVIEELIAPALRQGCVVLCDRFEDSTLAYQGYGGGYPLRTLKTLAQAARGGLKPDLTFLLDVDVSHGLKRSGRHDRMEKKSILFHKRVRSGFLTLARRERKRFCVISTGEPPSSVRAKIKEALDEL